MPPALPAPLTLQGRHLRIAPLIQADLPELAAVLPDPELYRHGYVMHRRPRDAGDALDLARGWCASPFDGLGRGRLPFAFRLSGDSPLGAAGTFVGTSSVGEAHQANESIHLGWTLLAPRFWGGVANPEAKLLLLGQCFEGWGYGRVKIQTDRLNTRSQAAIAKLGAVREGVLRRETRREDGTFRDTVVFSILADEWPRVKTGLEQRLAAAPG